MDGCCGFHGRFPCVLQLLNNFRLQDSFQVVLVSYPERVSHGAIFSLEFSWRSMQKLGSDAPARQKS